MSNTIVANEAKKDRDDFEKMTRPLVQRLRGLALRMTKNPVDAEDLTQDALLKAYRFFGSFKPNTNFGAWLYRILLTTYLNHKRKLDRVPPQVDFSKASATNGSPARVDRFAHPAIIHQYHDVFDDYIASSLDKVPDHYRHPLLLATVANLKYQEIADFLNIPVGTVMSRINRGRTMLAKSLQRYAQVNGFLRNALLKVDQRQLT